MSVISQPKNKTVAQVLLDLGYCNEPVTEKLPVGWREKAEKALKQRGIEVHMTTIYEVRRKEAARIQEEKARAAAMPTPQRLPPAAPVVPESTGQLQNVAQHVLPPDLLSSSPTVEEVTAALMKQVAPPGTPNDEPLQQLVCSLLSKMTMADAVRLRDYARRFGGLVALSKLCTVLATLGTLFLEENKSK